jgi:hypothetical protein
MPAGSSCGERLDPFALPLRVDHRAQLNLPAALEYLPISLRSIRAPI